MTWVRRLLISKGIAHGEDLLGLSDEEIATIEKQFDVSLPQTYKDFLADAGRSSGRLALDIDLRYPAVLELREEAEELLEDEETDYTLPAGAFVFMGYQGFEYHFFVCNQEDPPVWSLLELNLPPKRKADSFSEFFREMVATAPAEC